MKKLLTIATALCLLLPFSQASYAGKFTRCGLLIIDVELAEFDAIKKTYDTACKSGNAAKAAAKGAKTYNKIIDRWNRKGKKLFEKGRCDPDLNLMNDDFNLPPATSVNFQDPAEEALTVCNGIDDMI